MLSPSLELGHCLLPPLTAAVALSRFHFPSSSSCETQFNLFISGLWTFPQTDLLLHNTVVADICTYTTVFNQSIAFEQVCRATLIIEYLDYRISIYIFIPEVLQLQLATKRTYETDELHNT